MEETTKVDRRVIRTRQSITKAFLELFQEKEFEAITINDIADRANVNRGTIYLHYVDKFDLLDQIIEEHIKELISLCKRREGEEIQRETLQEPEPFFDYLRSHYPFFLSMFSNERVYVFRERLLRFIADSLLEKKKEAGNTPEVEDELNAQFMASAFIGIVEWWVRREMPYSPEFMAGEVQKLFARNQIYPNKAQEQK